MRNEAALFSAGHFPVLSVRRGDIPSGTSLSGDLPIPQESKNQQLHSQSGSAIQKYVPKGTCPRCYEGLVPFV
jgi:hypothetical protein